MYEARLTALRRAVQSGTLLFGDHAARQMRRHGILRRDVETAIMLPTAEIVEDYPEDVRGATCLLLSWIRDRAIHVVLTLPPRPFVVTTYWPDSRPERWSSDFRRRMP